MKRKIMLCFLVIISLMILSSAVSAAELNSSTNLEKTIAKDNSVSTISNDVADEKASTGNNRTEYNKPDVVPENTSIKTYNSTVFGNEPEYDGDIMVSPDSTTELMNQSIGSYCYNLTDGMEHAFCMNYYKHSPIEKFWNERNFSLERTRLGNIRIYNNVTGKDVTEYVKYTIIYQFSREEMTHDEIADFLKRFTNNFGGIAHRQFYRDVIAAVDGGKTIPNNGILKVLPNGTIQTYEFYYYKSNDTDVQDLLGVKLNYVNVGQVGWAWKVVNNTTSENITTEEIVNRTRLENVTIYVDENITVNKTIMVNVTEVIAHNITKNITEYVDKVINTTTTIKVPVNKTVTEYVDKVINTTTTIKVPVNKTVTEYVDKVINTTTTIKVPVNKTVTEYVDKVINTTTTIKVPVNKTVTEYVDKVINTTTTIKVPVNKTITETVYETVTKQVPKTITETITIKKPVNKTVTEYVDKKINTTTTIKVPVNKTVTEYVDKIINTTTTIKVPVNKTVTEYVDKVINTTTTIKVPVNKTVTEYVDKVINTTTTIKVPVNKTITETVYETVTKQVPKTITETITIKVPKTIEKEVTYQETIYHHSTKYNYQYILHIYLLYLEGNISYEDLVAIVGEENLKFDENGQIVIVFDNIEDINDIPKEITIEDINNNTAGHTPIPTTSDNIDTSNPDGHEEPILDSGIVKTEPKMPEPIIPEPEPEPELA